MINKAGLHRIIDLAANGSRLLPGEVAILREAVDLLDDLSSTVDKIIGGDKIHSVYDLETTQQLKIIEQGKIIRDDQHGGNRP